MKIYRFLLKFTGNDDEINLLGDGTEKPEFGEWAWMSPEQVVDLVGSTFPIGYLDLNPVIYPVILIFYLFSASFVQAVEFKKPVYKEVLTVFSPHLQSNL